MAKNRISDLNDHLFAELERLGDENLAGEKLVDEIGRAQAISTVAARIIESGSLALRAVVIRDQSISGAITLPKMLE